MSDKLRYIGPLKPVSARGQGRLSSLSRRIPTGLAVVVGIPTLLAAVYWGLIATPRYVAESHFTVHKTDAPRANSLGLVLQNVGVSVGATESFAVQEYILSRDSAEYLHRTLNLEQLYSGPGVDMFSKYPGVWADETDEGRFKALKRYVSVTYNSTSGITKLRVQAFKPDDAQKVNLALLASAEELVNRLNQRASDNAVKDAERLLKEATERRARVQQQLTEFRNRERILDPQITAAESTQLVGTLQATAAGIRAELNEIKRSAPQSPQIPILEGRLASYEAQITEARNKLVGEAQSLAPKVSAYETLVLEREMSDKAIAEATAGVISAQQDARRQKLYLDRIVEPSKAEKATEPQRLRAILLVFLTSVMVYLLGRLLWAGLREHRQE